MPRPVGRYRYIFSNPTIFHSPVSVFSVRLVCLTVPSRTAPDSTRPLATGRLRWFSPSLMVKLASRMSHGLRVATDGEPWTCSLDPLSRS